MTCLLDTPASEYVGPDIPALAIPLADPFVVSVMRRTAESFQKLASLRGISSSIDVTADSRYVANGIDCGTSVHGLYEWLEKQPGVQP